MIAGEPKTYKSTQATDLALSVASGKPYLDYFPVRTPGAVLYVQEENGDETVQDRIFKIAASKGLLTSSSSGWALPDDLPIFFSNNCGLDLTSKDSRALLESTIRELDPVLVILDPLYMMMGMTDENSATEVGDVLRWLTSLRNAYGVSLLICHHYGKGNGTTRAGQRIRGSSAFHAWVESAIYVKNTPELYTVRLEREFRAYPTMPELTLKTEFGAPGDLFYRPQIIEAGSDAASELSDELKAEDICTFIGGEEKDEEEIMTGCKLSKNETLRLLAGLIAEGRVEKARAGGGRGRKATYSLA
jgi:hypothetical protein